MGKSIQVARNGEKLTKTEHRSSVYLGDKRDAGSVSVFLREKFWLEFRPILDAGGNPCTSKRSIDGVDLDKHEDGNGKDGPAIKKVK